MGFLDSVLGPVLQPLAALDPTGIVAGITGTAQAPGGGTAPGISPVGLVSGVLGVPGNVLGTAQDLLGGVLGGGAGGAVDSTGFGGGNGKTATRTVVETMDLMTGAITRRKIMPGSPFLMNSDVKAAKRVFRQSANLQKRLPRKTVKASATSQLKDAAIDAAIRAANDSGERAVVVKT